MTKKKWLFVMLGLLFIAGYWKLFYKSLPTTAVAKSADHIVAIDVKKVINTVIWNIITTPSQWTWSKDSKDDSDKVSLEDMVKLPDYVFLFHVEGQPINAWYTLLEVKDADDFAKGLVQYHFEKKDGHYHSVQLGLDFIQHGSSLLLANAGIADKQYLQQTANELFVTKQFYPKDSLQQRIDQSSGHAWALFAKNPLLENEYFVNASFSDHDITIQTGLPERFNMHLVENSFKCSDSSLCSLMFTQPGPEMHPLLGDTAWAGLSRALNFNIDSLLVPTNLRYQLDVEGIHERVDSAVSYYYDDNFNPIEKVVVNIVEEPAFLFTVQGTDINPVYQYWKNNDKLETTAAGELFTPVPFVKSYCHKKNDSTLSIIADQYKALPAQHSIQCILFFRLLFTRIPASLWKYLPDWAVSATTNLSAAELSTKNEKGIKLLKLELKKKTNDKPIIPW